MQIGKLCKGTWSELVETLGTRENNFVDGVDRQETALVIVVRSFFELNPWMEETFPPFVAFHGRDGLPYHVRPLLLPLDCISLLIVTKWDESDQMHRCCVMVQTNAETFSPPESLIQNLSPDTVLVIYNMLRDEGTKYNNPSVLFTLSEKIKEVFTKQESLQGRSTWMFG